MACKLVNAVLCKLLAKAVYFSVVRSRAYRVRLGLSLAKFKACLPLPAPISRHIGVLSIGIKPLGGVRADILKVRGNVWLGVM